MNKQQKIEKIREILIQRNCIEPDIKQPRIVQSSIINLEVLLVALNNNNDYSYYSFGTGDIYCSEVEWSCSWIPNKILENQSEETIDTIYNILF